MKKLAILDDYERLALALADWTPVKTCFELDVFHRHLVAPDEAAEALAPYEVICLIRERTPMPASLIKRLPNLKFVAATGPWNRTIDFAAAQARGIVISHTVARDAALHATAELTWGLAIAAARNIAACDSEMRLGIWGSRTGRSFCGKRLGLLGLGNIGQHVARIGKAFGMEVVAWSANLSDSHAAAVGARRVSKEELLRTSDLVSIHLILSERTRGLLGRQELSWMKPTAILVNTARGAIVDEEALVAALCDGRIGGAGLDVFDREPLPPGHALARLPNVVLTPHLGFSTEEIFRGYFEDTVENVLAYSEGKPIRLLTGDDVATRAMNSRS